MRTSNRILFLVPDSVGIRNYLYSDILEQLKEKADIVIWSKLPHSAFFLITDLFDLKFDFKQFSFTKEPLLVVFLRESCTCVRLRWNARKVDNSSILDN